MVIMATLGMLPAGGNRKLFDIVEDCNKVGEVNMYVIGVKQPGSLLEL